MIRQFLDLSTNHVSQPTAVWLDQQGRLAAEYLHFENEAPMVTMGRLPNGWFVWAGDRLDPDNWTIGALLRGVPEDLLAVLTHARSKDCDYVLFDADANVLDGLNIYEW